MIAILAGDKDQAMYYADRLRLPMWSYIEHAYQIAAQRDLVVILLKGWDNTQGKKEAYYYICNTEIVYPNNITFLEERGI